MADLKSLSEQLVNLTVKEVQELAEILKNEYGIVPAASAVLSGGGFAAQVSETAEQPQSQEKTEFDVILKAPGGAKLAVIKLVKELTGVGLQEAKKLVDSVPAPVKKAISRSEAESMKSRLEEAGAEAEVV